MILDDAVIASVELRIKLRKAMVARAPLDGEALGRDDRCPFGRWLHGEAGAKYGALAAYRDCRDAHAELHRRAGEIALMIKARRFDEAEAALAGQDYAEAANRAIASIHRLRAAPPLALDKKAG